MKVFCKIIDKLIYSLKKNWFRRNYFFYQEDGKAYT